jgi:hypothetical protein
VESTLINPRLDECFRKKTNWVFIVSEGGGRDRLNVERGGNT